MSTNETTWLVASPWLGTVSAMGVTRVTAFVTGAGVTLNGVVPPVKVTSDPEEPATWKSLAST